jgi:formimidoylglutamate deiminase
VTTLVEVAHLHQPGGWLSPGYLLLDDRGLISSVGCARPTTRAERMLRLDGWGIPGMPDLHSHAFQRALAGHAERAAGATEDDFWTWRPAMYRLAAALEPDDVEAISAQAFAELLEGGFTSVAEFHYLHHAPDGTPYADPAELGARVLAAAASAGIGITLLPVLYARDGFDRPASGAQRRFVHADASGFLATLERSLELARRQPRAAIGFAAHSLRAVSAELLAEALALIDQRLPAAPRHVHAAEQRDEVAASLAHLGARPVEWLLEHAGIDGRWCLVHATHVSDGERARLARSGAVAGLCPGTEADLGDGLFPLAEYLQEGGALGVGSDSQVAASAPDELRLLELGQRLAHTRRNVAADRDGVGRHTGRRLWEAACAGGARAVGQPVGALLAGARCDLVVLDPRHPRLAGHGPETVLDALVLGGAAGSVCDVLVGGEPVVREGRHVRRDAIRAGFDRALARVAAKGAFG